MEKIDYVIDIQAFHDKDGIFLPKEIAVLGLGCNFISHWVIKAPYSSTVLSRKVITSNSYLSCHHHGIEWFDGESNIKDVCKTLQNVARNAVRIYVRGAAKAAFLENILARHIINLETYGCPSFRNLPRVDDHFCFLHSQKKEYLACALTYAYKLRRWLLRAVYERLPSRKTSKNSTETKSCQTSPTIDKASSVCSCDTTTSTLKTTATTTHIISEDEELETGSYHYYDPVDAELNDEHTSNPGFDTKITSSNGRSIPSRQNSPGIDETDCNCC